LRYSLHAPDASDQFGAEQARVSRLVSSRRTAASRTLIVDAASFFAPVPADNGG
jgi:hypothetical protein